MAMTLFSTILILIRFCDAKEFDKMCGLLSSGAKKLPSCSQKLKNLTNAAKVLGFLDMLPSLTNKDPSQRRDDYLKEVRSNVPKFLAYIEIFGIGDSIEGALYPEIKVTKVPSIGSGSLVNTQYVLTAGHCICIPDVLPCKVTRSGSYEANYNPKNHFIIWLALDSNLLELRYSVFIEKYRYRVQSVFLHPKYRLLGKSSGEFKWDTDDIGLMKLETPICTGPNIGPASLPIGWRADIVNNGDIPSREEEIFKSKDPEDKIFESPKMKLKEIFRSGYGIPHEANTCRTWDGRSPLQKCKFPFRVEVPPTSRPYCNFYNRTFDKCIQIDPSAPLLPPDYYQPICQRFESVWPRNKDGNLDKLISIGTHTMHNILRLPFEPGLSRPEFYSNFAGLYQVVDLEKNCTTDCAISDTIWQTTPFTIAKHGWCATCNPKAKRGEPNYCGSDMATANEPEMFRKEMGVARPGENWGFCSDECDHVEKTFRYDVKFTGIGLISYLSDKKCQELLGADFIDIENEFCAGNLVVDQRRRFKILENSIVEIEPLVDWENLTYVGGFNVGSTVCGGDSGGPAFLPIVLEWENFNLTGSDLFNLAKNNVTLNKKTEKEVLENIVRDPILIGVTRRSLGCGIQNKPAIYGKIWKYVDWIEKTISDAKPASGNCGKRPLPKNTVSFSQAFRERGYSLVMNDNNTADVNSSTVFNDNNLHIYRSLSFKNGPKNKTFDLDIEGVVELE